MLRIINIGVKGLFTLGFFGLVAIYVIAAVEAPPPLDVAALKARAKQYDVEIKRDEWGVPHVYGKRDEDVAFGFAYAHSEDDFRTIEETAIAVRGKLASIKGKDAAVTDYLVHLMRVWETVDARYEKDLTPKLRHVLEAYADGVNYYAALHPEKVALGFQPLTGRDVAAGFVFKTPFFYGLDGELMKLFKAKKGSLSKDGKDAFLPTATPLPIGSNGMAVGPSRSADHATRLLVNSHQPYTGPVAWYEAVLHSQEGWDVAGGFFPGSPFMLHGHNRNLGWANTVNKPDLVDVYRLTINPDNPDQYLLDGVWRDFEKTKAHIRVHLWGPFWWTVTRDVLYSEHGPVLKVAAGTFAIRYAGHGEVRQAEEYYRLDKAQNFGEWRDALRLQALPSINYIYADKQGNISYVYNGLFPVRKPGFDWQGILPGDRSDLIWTKYVPFDDIPQLVNPNSGYVFNSNNTPFQATGVNDNLKPADFPAWMGIQTNMTNRAYRAEETFGADTSITADEFRKYKYDDAYSKRSEMAAMIAKVTAEDPGNDADLKQAQAILKGWDMETNIASRGAALGVLMAEPVVMAELKDTPAPDPMETLKTAIKTLKTHFGRIDPEWGQVNRFRRGTFDAPIDGGPDTYRAVYGEPQKDGTLTAVAGDTFIMFVQWDAHGKLSSQSIHQFGSATLDKNSPHYADQSPLFVAEKTKPVLFTADELKGHVVEDYRPGERHKVTP